MSAAVCKGTHVIFEMVDGPDVRPTASSGMLHEPGRRYIYVGPFRKGEPVDRVPDEAQRYLGRFYTIHRGGADIPRSGPWERIGEVTCIFYQRHGDRAGRMRHKINKPSLARLFKGKSRVTLSKHGSWYRVELPSNAIVELSGISTSS